MLRLLTEEEVVRTYGDPRLALEADGQVSGAWQQEHLATFSLDRVLPLSWGGSVSHVTCHRLVAPELNQMFRRLAALPTAWEAIHDYGGCFMFRRNAQNPRALSRHAWGIAMDLDVKENPLGGRGTMSPQLIMAFYDIGWYWGGWFSHPDPMHFEKAACLQAT